MGHQGEKRISNGFAGKEPGSYISAAIDTAQDRFFTKLIHSVGYPGLESLLADLTIGEENNWKLANKWQMTIHDVRFLRQNTVALCGFVLNQKRIARRSSKFFNLAG